MTPERTQNMFTCASLWGRILVVATMFLLPLPRKEAIPEETAEAPSHALLFDGSKRAHNADGCIVRSQRTAWRSICGYPTLR